ncbi:Spermatogenesis-associated protein 5, partial [Globisporangium splendens]
MAKQSAGQQRVAHEPLANAADAAALRGRVQFVRGGTRSALGLSKVYLSPQDMSAFRIDAGVHVAVFAAGDESVEVSRQQEVLLLCGIAWPMDKIKRHGVGLSSMWEEQLTANKQNELVRVIPLQRVRDTLITRKETKHVALQVVSRANRKLPSEKENALLVRYVTAMLDGVLLHMQALISLSVHGVNTVFRVIAISEESDSRRDDNRAAAAAQTSAVYRISGQTNVAIKWTPPAELTEQEDAPETSRNAASEAFADTMSTSPLRGFALVGGLKAEIETIRQIIEQPLVNPDMFKKFGLPPPKGLLMFGSPGTGKTMIARALAAELNAKIFFINGPEVVSKYIGESEANLRKIFENAARIGPSLIFIDEIDAICPKRDGRVGDMEKRMVATLLTLMDGLEKNAQVVVLAATNRPNALDPAIRRPGRFDREVEISIPNANDRLDILRVTLARLPHNVTDDQLLELSGSAHGYVGADLSALCKEAALLALQCSFASRQQARQQATSSALPHPLHPTTHMPPFVVEITDLKHAMNGIRPSALREIAIDVPRVLWNDIGGQHMIKQQLKEAVEWPLKHPEAFTRMGIRPPKGVLLYGPPGCSKTLTAKALATESSMNFIAIKGPELFSKWVGESEKAVQSIFRKARAAAPTVVFFDEIDAIASQRGGGDGGGSQVADRVLSQLLTELDGIEPLKQVLVVAATNRPDLIDSALMRPGRIDRVLYVGPPDLQARHEILSIHCRKIPLASDVNLQELAIATARFSGAELYSLCREAAMAAIEESKTADVVSIRHFLRALTLIQPQIDDAMLAFFDNFRLVRMKSKQ